METDTPVDKETLGDTSKYIRTYAKDMALLAGKGGATSAPPTETSKKERREEPIAKQAKPKAISKESVVIAEPEESFFSRPVSRADREEAYQEVTAIPTRAELDSIIEQRPAAAAREEAGPIPLMPKQQESVTKDAPVPDANKHESILARLRAKVSKDSQMDIQPLPRPEAPKIVPSDIENLRAIETAQEYTQVLSSEPSIEVAPAVVAAIPAPIMEEPIPEPEPEPAPMPIPEPIRPEPAPFIPPAAPQPIEPPAPAVLPTYREAIPEPVPEPEVVAPIVVPVRTPLIPPADTPSPLHTYSTDFAGHIDEREASTFSVLAAQADAGLLPAPASAASKKKLAWVPVVAGILLLVVGGSGFFFVYQYVAKLHAVPSAAPSAPSLIFVDSRLELHGTGNELLNALAQAANNPIPDGTVLLTYVTQATTTPKGLASFIPAPGGSLISALQLPAPDILLRNVDPASTVGVIHAGAETKPFFILRVTSYERTFAGMLTWEPVLWRDLSVLYPLYAPVLPSVPTIITTGTTTSKTASTTPIVQPIPVQGAPRAVFEDAVVASHDVRILHDTNGQTLLIYGYYDKATLVIARDEAAFTALLNRLSATTVQ